MASWDIISVLIGVILLFIGLMWRSLTGKLDELTRNLKYLNDKVLDEYVKQTEMDRALTEIERSIHNIRSSMQVLTIDVNVLKASKDVHRSSS
jgi:hypothetical protein